MINYEFLVCICKWSVDIYQLKVFSPYTHQNKLDYTTGAFVISSSSVNSKKLSDQHHFCSDHKRRLQTEG